MGRKKGILACECTGLIELLDEPELENDLSITQWGECHNCEAQYLFTFEPVGKEKKEETIFVAEYYSDTTINRKTHYECTVIGKEYTDDDILYVPIRFPNGERRQAKMENGSWVICEP